MIRSLSMIVITLNRREKDRPGCRQSVEVNGPKASTGVVRGRWMLPPQGEARTLFGRACAPQIERSGWMRAHPTGTKGDGNEGGAKSRTVGVEGPRLHKRGFASAEDGEVPR